MLAAAAAAAATAKVHSTLLAHPEMSSCPRSRKTQAPASDYQLKQNPK